jgi:hypothetical protein
LDLLQQPRLQSLIVPNLALNLCLNGTGVSLLASKPNPQGRCLLLYRCKFITLAAGVVGLGSASRKPRCDILHLLAALAIYPQHL